MAALVLSACASTAEAPSLPTAGEAPGSTLDAPGDTTPDTTPDTAAGSVGVGVVVPAGFDRRQAIATAADGSTCALCVWIADTAPLRSLGLKTVTDLGAADAMAFVYPDPHTGTFWMKDTVLPLSIAFFAADGAFLSSFDMQPCTESPCRSYPTADDFLVAVEVPQGDLADLGLVAGSTLELLDLPCDD